MPQITDAQYKEFQQYQLDRATDKVLTPERLQIICAQYNYDATKIGNYILNIMAKTFRK